MCATEFDGRGWLHGMIADLPTPFHADGTIDLVTFARLCERQACAGASAVLVGDTIGEGETLSDDEHATLIRTAAAIARRRLRVIAGIGSNCTARAIANAERAKAAGADAVMAVVPYYNKPTMQGIAAHFEAIIATTPLPIVLHDAPQRCVRALDDATIIRLAASPRIIGLRDDAGDAARLARLRLLLPPGFRLLGGDDTAALLYLLGGGDGVVSAIANVAPQLTRGMYVATRKGCPRYATTIADMLAPLAAVLQTDQAASAVKVALALRGFGDEVMRLPRLPLDATERHLVQMAMDAIWASPDEVMARRA